MSRCRTRNLDVARYQVKEFRFRYGTGTSVETAEWDPLTDYTGYGNLQQSDGTLVPFTVTIEEESVADEGGQVVVGVDASELLPGRYPYDVWLTPPSTNAFQWLSGEVVVAAAVSPPP